MRYVKAILLLLMFAVAAANVPVFGQTQATPSGLEGDNSIGGMMPNSLGDLRSSRRVILLVRRSNVVDTRGQAKAIITEAYRGDPDARLRYPRLFNTLARKLNNYMKKYGTITAVKNVADTDFIIFFNLLEYRRPLGYPYPYGELFVIFNDRLGKKPPRIIWKTRKSPVWAEDAIEDFINDLKSVRGES
jgi:hypothetical protein